ncbi:MAG: ATP-binding protein [Kofleriaceae bacterium]
MTDRVRNIHSLLRRQLKRYYAASGGDLASLPPELAPLLQAVNDAYHQSDVDRAMLERSLELSSEELGEANTEMQRAVAALQDAHGALESRVEQRTHELLQVAETLRQANLDQQKLEAQLRQAQKMEAVGRLAGGIAHDFNNLLTVMFGQLEVLEESDPTEQARGAIVAMQQAAESAMWLTHQLLTFSRQQPASSASVNVSELIRTTQMLLRRLIGEDVELVTQLDQTAEVVRGDAGQLQQVLLNLVVNARDAMPRGGRLTITTAARRIDPGTPGLAMRPGDYLMISVSDTGIGMNTEVKARIFEPFFTTKEATRGTGLGLATVYGIVHQSGGYIEVISEVGRGSTFHITLPRVTAATLTATDARGRPPSGSGCILVVEDQEAVRKVMCRRLERAGYTVLEATNGEVALAAVAAAPRIDLVLTDVVMPQMNGRMLAEELARLRPEIKVLYMTGYSQDVDVMQDMRERSRTLLQKPFSAAALLRAVEQMLAS